MSAIAVPADQQLQYCQQQQQQQLVARRASAKSWCITQQKLLQQIHAAGNGSSSMSVSSSTMSKAATTMRLFMLGWQATLQMAETWYKGAWCHSIVNKHAVTTS